MLFARFWRRFFRLPRPKPIVNEKAGPKRRGLALDLERLEDRLAPAGLVLAGNSLVVTATNANSGSYVLDGGSATPFALIDSLEFDGNAGGDSLTIVNPAASLFAPTGGILFKCSSNPGDVDRFLNQGGLADTPGTCTPSNTSAPYSGTIVHTNNGLTLTQTINFSGMTSAAGSAIEDTVSESNFTINGTTGAEQINIGITPVLGGPLTMQVDSSPSNTFETIDVANKTLTTVNGLGGVGGDTFNVGNNGDTHGIVAGLALIGGGADTANIDDHNHTAGADTVTVTSSAVTGNNTFFGTGGKLTYSSLANLNVQLGSDVGNAANTANIQSTSAATTITGGTTNDTINVSGNAPTLNTAGSTLAGIVGTLNLNLGAGAGTQAINISDFGDTVAGNNSTIVLTNSAVTGFGGASAINYSAGAGTINTLDLEGSNTLGNTFNVQSTNSLFTNTINGNGGTDTVNVSGNAPSPNGAGSVLAGIAGVLNVNLGAGVGTQAINISDFDDTAAGNNAVIILTNSAITGLGGANTINYSAGAGTVNTLDLEGSNTLGNVFNVQGTSKLFTTTINGNGGTDTINVTGNAPSPNGAGSTLAGIAGVLNLNLGAGVGTQTINVSDFGDTAAGNNSTIVLTNSAITGFGGANTINYSASAGTTNTLDLEGSNTLGNIFNVQSTNILFTTTINGNGGTDNVNVTASAPALNNAATSNLAGIVGVLNINLGAGVGTQAINISDFGDTAAGNNSVIVLTSSAITGFGGANTINYSAGAGTTNTLDLEGSNTLGNTFNVQSTSNLFTTTINGNGGTDTVNVSGNAPSPNGAGSVLAGIAGVLNVNLGAGVGTQAINISDFGDTNAANNSNVVVKGSAISGFGGANTINYSAAASTTNTLDLEGSDTLADVFNVQSTNSLFTTTVNANGGADAINVSGNAPSPNGAGSVLAGIAGVLNLNLGASVGTQAINVSDFGDTAAGNNSTILLTNSAITGFGGAKAINYSASAGTTNTLDLEGSNTLGSIFNVQSTNSLFTTTINGNGGTDTVNVTASAPALNNAVTSTLAGIAGVLNINLGAGVGTQAINISDFGDTAAGNNTIIVLTSSAITGFGGANTISYSASAGTTNTLDLEGSNTLGNIFNVQSTSNLFTTTINGNGGTDTVNVSGNAPSPNGAGSVLAGIAGVLNVNLGAGVGTQAINVSDFGDTAAGNNGTIVLTSSAITGFGGANTINYSAGAGTTNTLDLEGSDTLGNTFNVQSTNVLFTSTINGNGGTDTVNVTASAPTLNSAGSTLIGIAGVLNVNLGAAAAAQAINISDFGDTTAGHNTNIVVTNSAITGFGGANTINYSASAGTTDTLDLEGSNSLADTFNVQSTNSLFTTTVNGNSGVGNVINVASPANQLAGIQGLLLLKNSNRSNTVNINDSGDATPQLPVIDTVKIGAQVFGRLHGLGNPADIEWNINDGARNETAAVNINAGSGGNAFAIYDNDAAFSAYTTTLNTGSGDDTVNVLRVTAGNSLQLNGQAGNDTVNVISALPAGTTLGIDGGTHTAVNPGNILNLVNTADVISPKTNIDHERDGLVVNTAAEAGVNFNNLSLREALQLANIAGAAAIPETITFAPALSGQPILLTSTLEVGKLEPGLQGLKTLEAIAVQALETITGGASLIAISGNNTVQDFLVDANAVAAFNGLTLFGGKGGTGGAVNNSGTLTITNSTLTGNAATFGGAIDNLAGILNLTDDTFYGNTADNGGGAINVAGGTVNLVNDTLTANTADNVPANAGGGGGLAVTGGAVQVLNTIVSLNIDNTVGVKVPNISGAITNLGTNLIDNATPLLSSPGDYGGTTATIPLLPGSLALDAGQSGTVGGLVVPTTDQRGKPRVGNVDIGAFESQGFTFKFVQPIADTESGVIINEPTGVQVQLIEIGGVALPGATNFVTVSATNSIYTPAANPLIATNVAITSASEDVSGLVTITTATPHGLAAGNPVYIASVGVTGYNGLFTVKSVLSPTQFTYVNGATGLATDNNGGKAVGPQVGPKTVQEVNSIATFPDLSIANWGTYTLTVSDTPDKVTSATSNTFQITADHLAFAPSAGTTNPAQVRSGDQSLTGTDLTTSQFKTVVFGEDITGATAQNFTGTVTLAINSALQLANNITNQAQVSLVTIGSVTLAYNGNKAPTAFAFNPATTSAASFLAYLKTIPGLTAAAAVQSVTGNVGGPYNVTFGAGISPIGLTIFADLGTGCRISTARLEDSHVFTTSVASFTGPGSVTLAYNGISAATALAFNPATTTAAQFQTYLQTVPGLTGAGAVQSVTGNTGGPFTIAFGSVVNPSRLTIANDPAHVAVIAPLSTVSTFAVGGVATFIGLTLNKWGDYTLLATTPNLSGSPVASATSSKITVTAYTLQFGSSASFVGLTTRTTSGGTAPSLGILIKGLPIPNPVGSNIFAVAAGQISFSTTLYAVDVTVFHEVTDVETADTAPGSKLTPYQDARITALLKANAALNYNNFIDLKLTNTPNANFTPFNDPTETSMDSNTGIKKLAVAGTVTISATLNPNVSFNLMALDLGGSADSTSLNQQLVLPPQGINQTTGLRRDV